MVNASTVNKFGGKVDEEAIDAFFVLFSTIAILSMQTGFGLLESGEAIRSFIYSSIHLFIYS